MVNCLPGTLLFTFYILFNPHKIVSLSFHAFSEHSNKVAMLPKFLCSLNSFLPLLCFPKPHFRHFSLCPLYYQGLLTWEAPDTQVIPHLNKIYNIPFFVFIHIPLSVLVSYFVLSRIVVCNKNPYILILLWMFSFFSYNLPFSWEQYFSKSLLLFFSEPIIITLSLLPLTWDGPVKITRDPLPTCCYINSQSSSNLI